MSAYGRPLVLITSPADHRLVTESDPPQPDVCGRLTVAARAWSAAGIAGCRCRINDGVWRSMNASAASHWRLTCEASEPPFALTVEARDNSGQTDTDTIRVATNLNAQRRRRTSVNELPTAKQRARTLHERCNRIATAVVGLTNRGFNSFSSTHSGDK